MSLLFPPEFQLHKTYFHPAARPGKHHIPESKPLPLGEDCFQKKRNTPGGVRHNPSSVQGKFSPLPRLFRREDALRRHLAEWGEWCWGLQEGAQQRSWARGRDAETARSRWHAQFNLPVPPSAVTHAGWPRGTSPGCPIAITRAARGQEPGGGGSVESRGGGSH